MEPLPHLIGPTGHPLALRRPRPDDAPRFLQLYSTVPAHRIGEARHALAEEQARIARHLADPHERYGFGLFVLTDQVNGEVVGRAGIKHCVAPEVGPWEIDYMLRADHRGRGLGHRVAAWIMHQVERRWRLDRVLAHVATDNTPSIRILEARGFERMGECTFAAYPEMGVLYRYEWTRAA